MRSFFLCNEIMINSKIHITLPFTVRKGAERKPSSLHQISKMLLYTRYVHKVLLVFVMKKTNTFKGISFLFMQSIVHLLVHTLTIVKINYKYLSRKTVSLLQQTIFKSFGRLFKISELLLCKLVPHWYQAVIVRCARSMESVRC